MTTIAACHWRPRGSNYREGMFRKVSRNKFADLIDKYYISVTSSVMYRAIYQIITSALRAHYVREYSFDIFTYNGVYLIHVKDRDPFVEHAERRCSTYLVKKFKASLIRKGFTAATR